MLALRNLLRRKTRTSLTLLGVGFAVATVVALISIARGFVNQFNEFFVAGDAHLVVTRKDIADPFLSSIPDGLIADLEATPGVAAAHPFLWSARQLPGNVFFFFFGTSAGSPMLAELQIVEGEGLYAPGAPRHHLLLGRDAARVLEKQVGETLELGGESFEVVGVFESATPLLASGGILPFREAQVAAGYEGKMSSAMISLERYEPEDIRAAEEAIEEAFPMVQASQPASFTEDFKEFEMSEDAMLLFSVLAIVIGGIGVMNTMLMSVFERTREIGVLQAIGWSKGMVLRQIVIEGVAICLVGGVLGIALGVFVVEAIGTLDAFTWVSGDYGPDVFLKAMTVTILMGVFGAAYPALRAVRITPIEALRYE